MSPIKFQITKVAPLSGQIEVLFYNEDIPNGLAYSIDVPIVNGQFIDGEELRQHISGYCPKMFFERAAALKATPDASGLLELVGFEQDVVV